MIKNNLVRIEVRGTRYEVREYSAVENVSANGTVDLFSWVGASSSLTGSAAYGINFSDYGEREIYGSVAGEELKKNWGEYIGEGYRTLKPNEWNYLFHIRESGATVAGTTDFFAVQHLRNHLIHGWFTYV